MNQPCRRCGHLARCLMCLDDPEHEFRHDAHCPASAGGRTCRCNHTGPMTETTPGTEGDNCP